MSYNITNKEWTVEFQNIKPWLHDELRLAVVLDDGVHIFVFKGPVPNSGRKIFSKKIQDPHAAREKPRLGVRDVFWFRFGGRRNAFERLVRDGRRSGRIYLLSGWLKEVSPKNTSFISVTLDTFHLLSGWSKEVAS